MDSLSFLLAEFVFKGYMIKLSWKLADHTRFLSTSFLQLLTVIIAQQKKYILSGIIKL